MRSIPRRIAWSTSVGSEPPPPMSPPASPHGTLCCSDELRSPCSASSNISSSSCRFLRSGEPFHTLRPSTRAAAESASRPTRMEITPRAIFDALPPPLAENSARTSALRPRKMAES
eukprot:scaffold132092_cov48-Phaeocystis_antarctica.AAC.2